jgi:hypothetical protein
LSIFNFFFHFLVLSSLFSIFSSLFVFFPFLFSPRSGAGGTVPQEGSPTPFRRRFN